MEQSLSKSQAIELMKKVFSGWRKALRRARASLIFFVVVVALAAVVWFVLGVAQTLPHAFRHQNSSPSLPASASPASGVN